MKFIFGIFYLGKRCVIFVDGLIDDLMMFMKFVIFLVCFKGYKIFINVF